MIAILATPQRDLDEYSVNKLETFLRSDEQFGRTLFYIASATQRPMSQMPNLSAWLEEWGIAVGDSVVFETNPALLRTHWDLTMAFVNYTENVFSAELRQRDLFPVIMQSRPLSLLYDYYGMRQTQILLEFSSTSGVAPEDRTDWNPLDADPTGPHPALLLSTYYGGWSDGPIVSHVLVSGSYHAFSADLLGQINYANADYFLTVLNGLTGREETVRIADRTLSVNSITLSVTQRITISIVVFIILPLSLLTFGIIVWWRRRHR